MGKRKTLKKLKGGIVIDSGGYGCLFSPILKCKNSNTRKKGYISKLQIKYNGENEFKQIMEIKKLIAPKIPNYNNYFILDVDVCQPAIMDSNDLINFDTKCGKLFSKYELNSNNINNNLNKVNILNMVNGGIVIDDFMDLNKSNKHHKLIFVKMYNFKNKALLLFNKLGILHNDIKANNFLINIQNINKSQNINVRLIDWGMSYIYKKNNPNLYKEIVFNGNYFQFNSPFSINLLNEDMINFIDKLLQKKSDQTKSEIGFEEERTTIHLEYNYIFQSIFNYLRYVIKNNTYRHLSVINNLFIKLFSSSLPFSYLQNKEDKKTQDYFLKNYTLPHICKYMTEIVIKYNRNNKFNILEYYENVYVINVDLWGYYLIFVDLFIDYAFDDFKDIFLSLLNYSTKIIDHRLMHKKLKFIYKKIFLSSSYM